MSPTSYQAAPPRTNDPEVDLVSLDFLRWVTPTAQRLRILLIDPLGVKSLLALNYSRQSRDANQLRDTS
ncbi:hypothetical protein KUV22_08485 [Microbulbifer agarilyticus]|uniref:hypothetical protein n=1 Tax=Microbulbifer agarilyticus TaxID=260552 RepID=UPI001C984DF5|nr:hypothetical protein [Microbulbifer agarilyticus]MBY6190452.1 hypothetical protein [Microbulbifer agarilyticus]